MACLFIKNDIALRYVDYKQEELCDSRFYYYSTIYKRYERLMKGCQNGLEVN